MCERISDVIPGPLMRLLERYVTTAIVGTVTPEGCPYTMPANMVISCGDSVIRIAMYNNSRTYANLKQKNRLAICFVDEGNVAYTVIGEADVLKERMIADEKLAIVEVRVLEVYDQREPSLIVSQGVRARSRSAVRSPYVNLVKRELTYLVGS